MEDTLKTDLGLVFKDDGSIDLDTGPGEMETLGGKDNLVQALKLRLLVYKGELSGLGHARHGTRIHDLIGEPLDRANIELMRRYVRQALMEDPRVEEVTRVVVQPRPDTPGAVDVDVAVLAVDGSGVGIEMTLNRT
jgi:phage baseplate assembly protein W